MTEITTNKIKRKTWTAQLKRDLRHFQARTGMGFTVIGIRAIKNARFWDRLQAGGTITLASADMLYAWMAEQGYHFNNKELDHDEGKQANEAESSRSQEIDGGGGAREQEEKA